MAAIVRSGQKAGVQWPLLSAAFIVTFPPFSAYQLPEVSLIGNADEASRPFVSVSQLSGVTFILVWTAHIRDACRYRLAS